MLFPGGHAPSIYDNTPEGICRVLKKKKKKKKKKKEDHVRGHIVTRPIYNETITIIQLLTLNITITQLLCLIFKHHH
jgi:hypothetical protein